MPDALYVYGIVKAKLEPSKIEFGWSGLEGKKVYIIHNEEYAAFVHDCDEKPYTSQELNGVKELIIAHNNVLDGIMGVFGGVMPLHFNTIIKKNPDSAINNLKKWLKDNKKHLGITWNKIKNKKEYGIRVYYQKDRIFNDAANHPKILWLKENLKGNSQGLSYLFQTKIKSKINELFQDTINQLREKIYKQFKCITDDVTINHSKVAIDEQKDLLISLSVLADASKINGIETIFSENADQGLSFQLVGPFAPYSFIKNET